MNHYARKAKGLTLLEVMVALFIFALTATSIMKAASEHLRGIATLEEITFATWVANNQLNHALVEQKWPPENNKKGSEEMGGVTWYWRQVVTNTQDSDLRQVEVFVSQTENDESYITSVTTFLANPTPTKQAAL